MKRHYHGVATPEQTLVWGRDGCLERGLLPAIGGESPVPMSQVGAYPLTGVGQLPNADIAFPGEVWTNKRANGVIVPGSCVLPVVVNGVGCVRPVVAGDATVRSDLLSVAMRQIMTPDLNPGSQYNPALGPNEIVNLPIADQDYVRQVFTGVVWLSLVTPDATYAEGDIIGWDPTGARPAGKASGTGAWCKHNTRGGAGADTLVAGTDIFQVHEAPRYYGASNEAVLACRFLRSNQ